MTGFTSDLAGVEVEGIVWDCGFNTWLYLEKSFRFLPWCWNNAAPQCPNSLPERSLLLEINAQSLYTSEQLSLISWLTVSHLQWTIRVTVQLDAEWPTSHGSLHLKRQRNQTGARLSLLNNTSFNTEETFEIESLERLLTQRCCCNIISADTAAPTA